nr:VOC family protein [Microvirga terricola]
MLAVIFRSALCVLAIGALFSLLPTALPVSDTALAESAPTVRSGSVSIRTADFTESVQWYQDHLDFRLITIRNTAPERMAVLERGSFLLEITEADHPAPAHAAGDREARVTHFPVITLLVQDVDEEIERLETQGVEILEEPEDDLDGSYRTAQIKDNGRHRIELREPLGSPASIDSNGR